MKKGDNLLADENFPQKTVIIGGGIIGALEAYAAYVDAKKNHRPLQVVVYEKSSSFEKGAPTNTAYHVCPSLTPDEALSVVPRGSELVEKLSFLFNQPGGIRVDDVRGANDSFVAVQFKQAVGMYGQDQSHEERTQALLALGKMGMDLWQSLYDEADSELKAIFEKANFHSCREPKARDQIALHDGYRIDLIYGLANAQNRAQRMQQTYTDLGYGFCKLLSPEEVMAIDPALKFFCLTHSEGRVWKRDAAALWRPGGCLSGRDFLPLFYAYLRKVMDFRLEFDKQVVGVELDSDARILGVRFQDGSLDQNDPTRCNYVFCPGEAVGTLKRFGFDEPSYAGFAGPSLTLRIPLSTEQLSAYKHCNHYMEVHKEGIVLPWQLRCKGDRLFLQAAGTKAFYGDQTPHVNEAFAIDRHLVQLNVMNDVLPQVVSMACGRDTNKSELTLKDVRELEEKGILSRWVGIRAVAYDGFPTLGALFAKGRQVQNGRCTTHLGSGGVSLGPAAVEMSRRLEQANDPFTAQILQYADSRR